jgi:heat shock protein HslJ
VTQRISDNSGEPRVPAGNAPTIEFDADGRTVSGSTGCNVYSGDATIGRGTISVTQVAVTDRACTPQEIMEQETLFLEILNRADQFTLGDRMLELIGVGGSVSLIESVPVTDATLDGTAWVLDSLIDGEVAMSILTTTTPSLTLDTGEGSIQGTTGCNTFGGTVMIDSSGFTVTDMNWTEIGCEPDIMRQETLILDVLQNAERYQIEGDRLTISSTQGRSLIYRTG